MNGELIHCPFCGEAHESNNAHVLTPEGWKPVKFFEYEPPKWYIRPFSWFLKLLRRRINHE